MRTANISSSAPGQADNRVDELIALLDQHPIGRGADSWVAHVLGVHIDGRELWVQIARADDQEDSVVLRLSAWATPQHALAALAVMDPQHGPFPHVIDVMRPA